MSRHALLALAVLLPLSGCTWVKLQPQAAAVRVAGASENLASCMKAGEIGVSVKANVAAYHRNPLKVRDELETMARNEALGLSADTVQPLGEPISGEQRFAAYRCGSAAAAPRAREESRRAPPGEAEVIPLRED